MGPGAFARREVLDLVAGLAGLDPDVLGEVLAQAEALPQGVTCLLLGEVLDVIAEGGLSDDLVGVSLGAVDHDDLADRLIPAGVLAHGVVALPDLEVLGGGGGLRGEQAAGGQPHGDGGGDGEGEERGPGAHGSNRNSRNGGIVPVFCRLLVAAEKAAEKSGIRTGWRRETERRRVATRPEWEAGQYSRGAGREKRSPPSVVRPCTAVLLVGDRLGVLDGIIQWCVIPVLGEADQRVVPLVPGGLRGGQGRHPVLLGLG